MGPVTLLVSIATRSFGYTHMTTKKLKSQFEAVERALAGALILMGVTSAGYSQDIPSHPIVLRIRIRFHKTVLNTYKKQLKINKHNTETAWAAELPLSEVSIYRPARRTIVTPIPRAHQSISGRRPTRSMMKMAMMLISAMFQNNRLIDSRCKEVACSVDSCDNSRHLWPHAHIIEHRCEVVSDKIASRDLLETPALVSR